MTSDQAILLVDDNEDDIFLMKRALQAAGVRNPLYVVEDGQQAIDYLAGTDRYADRGVFPVPAVVFLDLKLPFKSGHEVLAWIRSQPEYESLIVIVLTASTEPMDLSRAYRLGANSYVLKPPTVPQLLDLAKAFHWYWCNYNEFPKELKEPIREQPAPEPP